jgi:hypothetical protein
VFKKSCPHRRALYNFEFLILNFELICTRLRGQKHRPAVALSVIGNFINYENTNISYRSVDAHNFIDNASTNY